MRRYLSLGAAYWLVLAGLAHAQPAQNTITLPTCEMRKAGYDILTSRSFAAEDGSLGMAINAIADNHLIFSDDSKTAFATREQLTKYVEAMPPMDALLWLHRTFSGIKRRMIETNCRFNDVEIKLMSPKVEIDPNKKTCGTDSIPDLSQPLKK